MFSTLLTLALRRHLPMAWILSALSGLRGVTVSFPATLADEHLLGPRDDASF